jgi:uncharacterized protein
MEFPSIPQNSFLLTLLAFISTIYEIVCQVTKVRKTNQKHICVLSFAVIIILMVSQNLSPTQNKKRPQAFRNYEAAYVPLVLPSTLDMQLLEAFVLMQKANAGESPAQHELGLRYLLGRGFPADTLKAAFWIKKAADQHFAIAQFNLGILFINGRGVEWNPFEAYKYFQAASKQDNPEAHYVMGLLYTENFIVPRNWPKAYQYFKKALELGSEDAKLPLKEMERRGLDKAVPRSNESKEKKQSNKKNAPAAKDSSFSLLFIDFNTDTTSTIDDTTLIKEAYRGLDTLSNTVSSDTNTSVKIDSVSRSLFFTSAEACNPEALCLLGRCYERGLIVQKDVILAGVYYLRALHLDSYRAPALLWKLMNAENFGYELEKQSSKNNPDALYVWSGLTYAGFNKLLNEKQAFDLLQRAASMGHIPSIVDLGSCYFTGRWTQQDRSKAIEQWSRAAVMGSLEASVRIAVANVLDQTRTQNVSEAISILRNTAKDGSLLSTITLAYCYEKGIGLPQNKGEAYRLFHKSLMRGSETAFHALQRMHDDLRPSDSEFKMSDE